MKLEHGTIPPGFPMDALRAAAKCSTARECASYLRGRLQHDYMVLDSANTVTVRHLCLDGTLDPDKPRIALLTEGR